MIVNEMPKDIFGLPRHIHEPSQYYVGMHQDAIGMTHGIIGWSTYNNGDAQELLGGSNGQLVYPTWHESPKVTIGLSNIKVSIQIHVWEA